MTVVEWVITVDVDYGSTTDEQKNELFDLVADAVAGFEDKHGIEVFVMGRREERDDDG